MDIPKRREKPKYCGRGASLLATIACVWVGRPSGVGLSSFISGWSPGKGHLLAVWRVWP